MCSAEDILKARAVIEGIHTDDKIVEYILSLVEASRTPQICASQAIQALAPHIEYGISPRGTIALLRGAKARSALKGRGYVIPEDVQALFLAVCEHRVQTTFSAQSMGITPRMILQTILRDIARP